VIKEKKTWSFRPFFDEFHNFDIRDVVELKIIGWQRWQDGFQISDRTESP